MCWRCDNPDLTEDDYVEQVVRPIIETHRWFLQHVYGERSTPPFTYTVGLTAHTYPELVVTGLSAHRARDLLDNYAHHLVGHGGRPFVHGENWNPVGGGPSIEVVHLPHPEAHVFTALHLYGDQVRAQQLVYADDRGQWPWVRSFRGRQPVLGPRAGEAA